MHTKDPETHFRQLVRRNYEISKAIAVCGDLDERFRLRDEHAANLTSILDIYKLDEIARVRINNEEFKRAYPGQRIYRQLPKARRSQPWRQQTGY